MYCRLLIYARKAQKLVQYPYHIVNVRDQLRAVEFTLPSTIQFMLTPSGFLRNAQCYLDADHLGYNLTGLARRMSLSHK